MRILLSLLVVFGIIICLISINTGIADSYYATSDNLIEAQTTRSQDSYEEQLEVTRTVAKEALRQDLVIAGVALTVSFISFILLLLEHSTRERVLMT